MKALNNDRIVFAFFLQSSINRLTDDNLVVAVVVDDDGVDDDIDDDGNDDALRTSSMMKCMKSICLKVVLKLSG